MRQLLLVATVLFPLGSASAHFEFYSEFTTHGASSLDSFTSNGVTYLAVGNSSKGGCDRTIDSWIIRWDDGIPQEPASHYLPDPEKPGLPAQVQPILTENTHALEVFAVDGVTYLLAANVYTCRDGWDRKSRVYQWNGSVFVDPKELATTNAQGWEYFEIDGKAYLAATFYSGGSGYTLESQIYRWDEEERAFYAPDDAGFRFRTVGGKSPVHFTHDGKHFLAVIHHYDGRTYDLLSPVYQWHDGRFDFDSPAAELPTFQGGRWQHFRIDDRLFLMAANGWQRDDLGRHTEIFELVGSEPLVFGSHQSIASDSSLGLAYFEVNGEHYIAVSSFKQPSDAKPALYQWRDGVFMEHQLFNDIEYVVGDEIRKVKVGSVNDFEPMVIDGSLYLVLANNWDGRTHNLKSVILKWDEPVCTDTLAQCRIDRECPCESGWKNHGQYVSCVAAESNSLRQLGELDGKDRARLVASAARSSCGKQK